MSHSRLSYALPTTVRGLHFLGEKTSAISFLVDSRRLFGFNSVCFVVVFVVVHFVSSAGCLLSVVCRFWGLLVGFFVASLLLFLFDNPA